MDTLDYDYFFKQLKIGISIDEICFSFTDDLHEGEHYLGFLPQFDKPYWVGECDISGGCEYDTAEELVEERIFDGKSLKERWRSVHIVSIMGIGLEDWLKCCRHV
ncbi:hypothetical protein ACSVC9_12825 [Clostridium sp. LBM24168]